MMSFPSIANIDRDIDKLLKTYDVESYGEETRNAIKDAIKSLQKDKYALILKKKKDVQDMLNEKVITQSEFKEYMEILGKYEIETEKEAYPYMTEAANAINIALIKTELKELDGTEAKRLLSIKSSKFNLADKTWIRRRLAMIAKIHPEITPFKKLKKEESNIQEFEKYGYKIDEKEIKEKAKFYKYTDNGKPILVLYKFKGMLHSEKKNEYAFEIIPKDKLTRAYYNAYAVAFIQGGNPFTPAVQKIFKDAWKEEEKKTGKVIKESVMQIADADSGDISACFESVDDAVADGMIKKNVANHYKEYVKTIYEKETLLQSLERKW